MIKKAVLPAAGLGTRFLPAAKSQPKEMLPIIDKPAIHYVVEEIFRAKIHNILIVTGKGKRAIEDYFDKASELETWLKEQGKISYLDEINNIINTVNIQYVRQKEPRGLPDAIRYSYDFVNNDDFAVLLGDDIVVSEEPSITQLQIVYDKFKTSTVLISGAKKKDLHRYGVFNAEPISDRIYKIKGVVEKPALEKAPSNLVSVGRYIFTPSIFKSIDRVSESVKGRETNLGETIDDLIKYEDVYGVELQGYRYDVGYPIGLLKANIEMSLNRADMRKEVLEFLNNLLTKVKA